MTIQMTPVQKTLVQALILAIVLTAPLLFAQSSTGEGLLPATPQAPGSDRISSALLDKVKSNSTDGFTDGQHSKWTENAPAGIIQNSDIYKNSIILQHGDTHTLLPLHCVIFLPESHKNKVTKQAKGDFVAWPEFYTNNRNWLITHQISLKQAAGIMPVKPEALEQFKKINRVVVALYQHSPISALPSIPPSALPAETPGTSRP